MKPIVTISDYHSESVPTCHHSNLLSLGNLHFLWLSAVVSLVPQLSKLVRTEGVALTLNYKQIHYVSGVTPCVRNKPNTTELSQSKFKKYCWHEHCEQKDENSPCNVNYLIIIIVIINQINTKCVTCYSSCVGCSHSNTFYK